MKFTFICIVIVISCSVCTCNDLDIYSGLNFDFNKPRGVPRLPDYDRPSYYSKFRYPFENALSDDYDEPKVRSIPEFREFNSIPDKIRQYQEVIDWELTQLHKHRPRYETPPVLQYYLDKLKKPERFDLDIPTEDDLAIKTDDKTDEIENIFDDPPSDNDYGTIERLIPNEIAIGRTEGPSHDHYNIVHQNDKDTVEFTTTRFKNIKVVENPSEFAYAPSDPRFYRKIEDATKKTTEPTTTTTTSTNSPKFKEFDLETEKFIVNPRSDHQPSTGERLYQDIGSKDGSIDVVPIQQNLTDGDSAGVYIIAIVAGISAAATVGLIAVGIGWYNLQKHVKSASDMEYPTYGITGPNKDISPSGDRRLAQSAQMYHYQHQKQQVIAMERAPPGERHGSVSEADSEEENEEGDYTVYECPGLAPTGEMEVKNPLFQDDPTPAQTHASKSTTEEKK